MLEARPRSGKYCIPEQDGSEFLNGAAHNFGRREYSWQTKLRAFLFACLAGRQEHEC
jgi:hypothetical protein